MCNVYTHNPYVVECSLLCLEVKDLTLYFGERGGVTWCLTVVTRRRGRNHFDNEVKVRSPEGFGKNRKTVKDSPDKSNTRHKKRKSGVYSGGISSTGSGTLSSCNWCTTPNSLVSYSGEHNERPGWGSFFTRS